MVLKDRPDSKVNGANMGPIWSRQDPGGPHVGPMNFAIWGAILSQAGDLPLPHYGQLMPYGDIDLGQHWLG